MTPRKPAQETSESPLKNEVAVSDGKLPCVASIECWAAKRVVMTLNQFSFFAAVAKYLSMTKASAELHVSQPAISYQLKQLEELYGAKLYRRISNGVEITAAGQVFLRKITPILEQVATLEGGYKPSVPQVVEEVLSIGGTFSASAVLLPRLLARFRQSHPNTDFEFQTSVSENLERLVAKATLQIAVTDRQPPGPDLACEPLRREKVRAFVAAGHRLARRQNITLAEMLAEPLIIRGGKGVCGTTETALKRLREEGWTVRIGMRCDGPDSIKAAVRQRMGVGLAFEDSVKFEVAAGEFKILDVRDLRPDGGSYIIYSKPRPLSPLAQEFLELLREAKTVLLPGARSNRSSRSIASLRSKSLGEKQRMNRASALG